MDYLKFDMIGKDGKNLFEMGDKQEIMGNSFEMEEGLMVFINYFHFPYDVCSAVNCPK